MIDPILTERKNRKRWGKPKGLRILENEPRSPSQTEGSGGATSVRAKRRRVNRTEVRGCLGRWWVRGGVHGRLTLFARGANGPKSALKGVLRPFQRLLVSWSGVSEACALVAAESDGQVTRL